jgi:1-acyl-sn-glycerol-3-phosphate acyltransferase
MFEKGNDGTAVSAMRFAGELTMRGHTVRVLTCGDPLKNGINPDTGFDMYYVPELKVPLATRLAHKQSTLFGKPVRNIVIQAIKGADAVHLYEPWPLEAMAHKVAKKLNIPVIAAFHIQPENITYNLGLGWLPFAAHLTYYLLYLFFYRHYRHIHCPSPFIAAQLRHHGYKAKLHIISNGVHEDFFTKSEKVREDDGIFRILMTGRLSPEKRQDVLIKAVMKSKYKDRIQLYFAGRGPKEKSYKKQSQKLPHQPVFGYYEKPELIKLIHSCDLYVHTSDIEIEGISCMEAFCSGLVPVISNSKKSATARFALCKESLFRAGDAVDLAKHIDYWIEHEEERKTMGETYSRNGKRLSLEESVRKMERVYSTMAQGKNEYYHGRIFKFFARVFYTVVAIPLLFIWLRLVNGMRIRGINNLWGLKGALTVCNHVHLLDSVLVSMAFYPRKLIFPTLPENLDKLFPGILVNLLGGVPVPRTLSDMDTFFDEMEVSLTNGRIVHFFPEGHLKPYNKDIRDFKKGAFYLAARARVPLVPMTISFLEPHGLYKFFKRKPLMRLTVGKPIDPVSADIKEDERIRMQIAYQQMVKMGGCAVC